MLVGMASPDRPVVPVDVGAAALEAAGVSWPLVSPGAGLLMSRPGTRAVAAGLHTRALRQTADDTLAWDRHRGSPPLRVGPSREQQQALLAIHDQHG
jgi:2'-hydroxyisoflavone reductase